MKKRYEQAIKSSSAGFTLIELLISLSVIAIVFCCSYSFAPSLYKKNQLQVVTDDVKGALRFAKLQALLTGDELALTRLPGSSDWSEGMLLFIDNVKHCYEHDVKLLHEWHWKSAGFHMTWRGFQSDDYLLFTPDISSSTLNGSFIITKDMQQEAKLIVNRLGRVKVVLNSI